MKTQKDTRVIFFGVMLTITVVLIFSILVYKDYKRTANEQMMKQIKEQQEYEKASSEFFETLNKYRETEKQLEIGGGE